MLSSSSELYTNCDVSGVIFLLSRRKYGRNRYEDTDSDFDSDSDFDFDFVVALLLASFLLSLPEFQMRTVSFSFQLLILFANELSPETICYKYYPHKSLVYPLIFGLHRRNIPVSIFIRVGLLCNLFLQLLDFL